jgi:hypothetical protein
MFRDIFTMFHLSVIKVRARSISPPFIRQYIPSIEFPPSHTHIRDHNPKGNISWPSYDTAPVHPHSSGVPAETARKGQLNKKYANRVLHDVGLCIWVFDLVECGVGKVRCGDGFLWYKGASLALSFWFSCPN